MLDLLRRIVQEVNAASDLDQALNVIVRRVKQVMEVDVCSVYLMDHEARQLVLMATEGLNNEAVRQVRLNVEEGLVGLVAERAELVNLGEAPAHPRYRYFPATGEERYHAFLGVPIIHHRTVMGVLVVQQHSDTPYDTNAVNFLVTIASQLAGAIAHADAVGGIDGLREQRHDLRKPLQGLPGAPGVAIGTAVVVHPHASVEAVPDRQCQDPVAEEARFLAAVGEVRTELREMINRMSELLPAGDLALFEAYLMMLDGDNLVSATVSGIQAGSWAPAALRDTVLEHVRIFQSMDDPYLRERAEDIRDLGRRILQRLQEGTQSRTEFPKHTVLVGEEITASMLAEVPPKRLTGVVSVRGSRTSHVAILSRALGVPAVMGAEDLPVGRLDGREVIADGYSGRVYIEPTADIRKEFVRLQKEEAALSAELKALKNRPAETPDGRRIPLYANTGLVADIQPSLNSGAEGVGLYRTEFPFMVRDSFPGEEEQRQVYRQVLEKFHPRPVTMRTLDIGGDKALPYFPIKEDNPFLGWRGIRITLDHPEIFLLQIRAMLKSSTGLDNLSLLLPMVSRTTEVDEALELVHRAFAELREEGVAIKMPRMGVMVEVPSAVYQAAALARRVDFLSIGTNDLTQYLLAVDRNNPHVAEIFDPLHPAVIRAISDVVTGAHYYSKPVSVCGEMAGDPAAAILMIGLGMDALSMSASSLPRIKWVIRTFSFDRARGLLHEVLDMEDPHEIRAHLNAALEHAGLGGLVRAGK